MAGKFETVNSAKCVRASRIVQPYCGQFELDGSRKTIRNRLKSRTEALIMIPYADEAVKKTGQIWLDTMEDVYMNGIAAKAYISALEADLEVGCLCEPCVLGREILLGKDYLTKKSVREAPAVS